MALYLKYRPKDFESLVGQDFINTTLKKAVETDKTVGAYLLCGPRGTGKTSTARILAKAVNCKNTKKGNPCNKCEICNGINNESLVDVVEIDAASHTGVDNIREIIEKAKFSPTHAKNKIYIIDEVHMLSKGAFNALLKILEEPPSFVKFILATTETHKVPETIISRCQRYDFKRIGEDDIKSRLKYIAKQEKVDIDKKSLEYISSGAGGGLRNAISLFEQLIVDSKIDYKTVIKTLGIVEDDILDSFLTKLLDKNSEVITDFEEIISNGKNIKIFFKELIFYSKDKAIQKAKAEEEIADIIKLLDILDSTYAKTKTYLDENTTFLIGLLKIITNYQVAPTSDVTPIEKGREKQEKTSPQPSPLRGEGVATKKNEVKEAKQKIKQGKDLSHDDVSDIFGSTEKKPEKIKKTTKKTSGDSFDKEKLISELKLLGAKGGITMGIRGAHVLASGENLEFKFKTNFALKAANTSENIALINGALKKMGLEDLIVKMG